MQPAFWKQKIKHGLLVVGAVLVAANLGLAGSAQAQSDLQAFKIVSFEADYHLEKQANGVGAMMVAEKIVVNFPNYNQNHGIYRYLPNRYKNANLGIRLDSIAQNGQPAKYETSSENDSVVYKIGDGDRYVNGEVVYELKYWLQNVISQPDNNANIQELYWDINGVGWQQEFGQVVVRVHIPADLADKLLPQQACYTGVSGSTAKNCEMQRHQNADGSWTVTALTNEPLFARENLTLAIAFERGAFVEFKDTEDAKFLWNAFNILQLAALGIGIKGIFF